MESMLQKRSPPNIKFRLLSPETFEETLFLMYNHFFPREPVSICLSALQEQMNPGLDQNIINLERREWLASVMRHCPSTIIAQDLATEDKVVGVVIAGISRKHTNDGTVEEWYDMEIPNDELIKRWSEKNIEFLGEGLPVKTFHLLTLMRTVIKTAGDFWTKYECDEIFDIKYVTVDSNYARQNILTEMLCRSLSIARISGLKVAKAEASSIYSQAAFKKLGFETLASVRYEDYKGKDTEGNNVFGKTGIHKTIDFVTKSIPCFEYF